MEAEPAVMASAPVHQDEHNFLDGHILSTLVQPLENALPHHVQFHQPRAGLDLYEQYCVRQRLRPGEFE